MECIEFVESFPKTRHGPFLVFAKGQSLLKTGKAVEGFRYLEGYRKGSPEISRLQIEILAVLRLENIIYELLIDVFATSPGHGVDFTFFAIKELVFNRGFLEANKLLALGTDLFKERAPGAVSELQKTSEFISLNRLLWEKLVHSSSFNLTPIDRFTEINAFPTEWDDILVGKYPDYTALVTKCFPDARVASPSAGRACFYKGDGSRAEVHIGALPPPKEAYGFCIPDAKVVNVFDRFSIVTEKSAVVMELNPSIGPTSFGFAASDGASIATMESAFILPPLGDPGYFNAVLNGLFCLVVWAKYFRQMRLVIPNEPDRRLIHYLHAFGVDDREVLWGSRCQGIMFNNAVVFVNEGRQVSSRTISLVRTYLDKAILQPSQQSPLSDKIYISRRKSKQRKLENEEALEISLRSRGFEIVCFEDFSTIQQIRLSRNARVVVAPHGAGLTNIVFSNNLALLMELIPSRYHVRGFENIALQSGADYIGVFGPSLGGEGLADLRWTIDVQFVLELLAERGA